MEYFSIGNESLWFVTSVKESKNFIMEKIENLRELLKSKVKQKVDILALSQESLFFINKKNKKIDISQALQKMELIMNNGFYSLFVISLEKSNMEKLFFSKEENLFKLISKHSNNPTFIIFAAQSVLNIIKEFHEDQKLDLLVFSRRGVSKVSQEFKQQILNIIQN